MGLDDWKHRVCQCGHSKYDHADEHEEVPTGTGHCNHCCCTRFLQDHVATYCDESKGFRAAEAAEEDDAFMAAARFQARHKEKAREAAEAAESEEK